MPAKVITTETEYGTYTHGTPYRTEGGWSRKDDWEGKNGYKAKEYFHANGPDDQSAPHSQPRDGYNPECGWCYLNAGHTKDAHAAEIKAAQAK